MCARLVIERRLQENEIVSDKVTKIQNTKKPTKVYDVCVPGGHNYIGNGIISHNTMMSTAVIMKVGNKAIITASLRESVVGFYKDFLRFTNIPEEKLVLALEKTPLNDSIDMKDVEVVFVTYQKLAKTAGLKWLRKNIDYIGTLWVDECDQIAADMYSKVGGYTNPIFRGGSTATHDREDGRHYVTDDILGKINVEMKSAEVPWCHQIRQSGFDPGTYRQWNTYLRRISRSDERNKFIAEKVALHEYNQERMTLITVKLTETVEHHELMYKALRKAGIPDKDIIIVTGNTKNRRKIQEEIEKGKYLVIVGQQMIFQRVWTIEHLRTIILTAPVGNQPNFYQLISRIRNFTDSAKVTNQMPKAILIGDQGRSQIARMVKFKAFSNHFDGQDFWDWKDSQDKRPLFNGERVRVIKNKKNKKRRKKSLWG